MIRRELICFLLLFVGLHCVSQSTSKKESRNTKKESARNEALYNYPVPVSNTEGKWAYFSRSNKQLTPFDYDEAGRFGKSAVACVRKGKLYGLIKSDLSIVLEIAYRKILPRNQNGYLEMYNDEGQFGVISLDSHLVRWFNFKLAGRSNGKYKLIEQDDKKGLINLDYEIVLEPVYDRIDLNVVDGKPIPLFYKKDNEVGLLDSTTNLIANGKYDALTLDENSPDIIHCKVEKSWGVITKDGKEILPINLQRRAQTTNDGKAISFNRFGEYGLATLEGEMIIEGSSHEPMLDYELGGPIRVFKKNHIEFRSPEGKIFIEVPYAAKSTYNGKVCVQSQNRVEIYSPNGSLIHRLEAEDIDFAFFDRDGIVLYSVKDLWGMMSSDGKVILEPCKKKLIRVNSEAENMVGASRYQFQTDTSSGLLDAKGEVVFELDFPVLRNFDESGWSEYYRGAGTYEKIDVFGNVEETANRNLNSGQLTKDIRIWIDNEGGHTLANLQGKKLSNQKYGYLYYSKELEVILYSYNTKNNPEKTKTIFGLMNTDMEVLYEGEQLLQIPEETKNFFQLRSLGCENRIRKKGFVNAAGKVVLEPQNGHINYIPEQEIFRVQLKRQTGYIDLKGNLIGITQEDIDKCECCGKW